MKNLSLRKRLMCTIGAVSLLGLALVMVLAAKTSDVVRAEKESSVQLAAESAAKNIDKMMQERLHDILLFSASDAAHSGDPGRLVPYLNELVAACGGTYPAILVVNRHGKAIAVNTVDENMKPLPTDRVLGRDFSQTRWFQKAAGCSSAARGACVSFEEVHGEDEIVQALGRSGTVFGFTVPIRNGADTTGVLTGRISWERTVVAAVAEQEKMLQRAWLSKALISIQDKQGKFLIESPMATAGVYEARAELSLGAQRGPAWTALVQVPMNDSTRSFNLWIQVASVVLTLLTFFASWWVIHGTIRPFNSSFHELDTQSDDLRNASAQLTNASQDLAQAATEQSSSLQETASSIDQINSMINRSAENAERSIRIASGSQDAATRGKKVVDDMIHAISEISDSNNNILKQIEASNQQLTEIIKVISEIGNKTKVINDIAFQTKLLSFNASVEAARAGEHGKGFAVVAEEVGSLAQMSGNAAKDIGEMLNGSIQTVQSIVETSRGRVEKLIAEGKGKIDSGIQVGRQCESVLEEIVRAEAQMNSIINEIANASREQAQGMGEITKAVGQLDQVTNRNATIAQQTEGFAEAIARLAKSLREHVHEFRGLIEGGAVSSVAKVKAKLARDPGGETGIKNFSQELHDLFTSAEPQSNVIPFPAGEGQTQATGSASSPFSGRGVDEVPSESDPRFKEV